MMNMFDRRRVPGAYSDAHLPRTRMLYRVEHVPRKKEGAYRKEHLQWKRMPTVINMFNGRRRVHTVMNIYNGRGCLL